MSRSCNDRFIICVSVGKKSSIYSLRIVVGIDSSSQYLFGDLSIIDLTSLSVNGLKSVSSLVNIG